jgi:hypothetical protein
MRWAGVAAGVAALAGMVLVVLVIVFGPGTGRLALLAKDNTCQILELDMTVEGYQANLHLPAAAGDLLVVDIVPAEADVPDEFETGETGDG